MVKVFKIAVILIGLLMLSVSVFSRDLAHEFSYQIDPGSGLLGTIEMEHVQVHKGQSFYTSVIDSDYDKSDTINICFKSSD